MQSIQAYQLRPGGARARLALLRQMAAQPANNRNESTRLQPGDWKGARSWRLNSYESCYGTLSRGLNDKKPVWYSHHGENFRDERDCHEIVRSMPRGWYTDSDCHNTAIGIVCRLPHGRFLAGYRWTSNDERVYFPEIFDDETDAAHRANGHAEWFADQSREDSERFNAMADAEIAVTDALETLRDCLALRHTGRRDSDDVREAIQMVRQARETLADATRSYERGA